MESTGVYWIPVHQILEALGFDVVLVNARHVHSVPGRKSDVADCEWLRYLHSVGLLRGSFRPADEVCALRSVLRHRDTLIKTAARSVLHMQKAYSQMNVHLHHAISDLTGATGLAITDAILRGSGIRRGWPLGPTGGSRPAARLIRCRATGARSTCWRCGTASDLCPLPTTHRGVRSGNRNRHPRVRSQQRATGRGGRPTPQDEGTDAQPEAPTESPAKRFDLRGHLTHLRH